LVVGAYLLDILVCFFVGHFVNFCKICLFDGLRMQPSESRRKANRENISSLKSDFGSWQAADIT